MNRDHENSSILSLSIAAFAMMETTADKVDLVKFYFMNGECVTAAVRAFCTCRSIKKKENAPNYNSVKRMIENFLETGSVNIM